MRFLLPLLAALVAVQGKLTEIPVGGNQVLGILEQINEAQISDNAQKEHALKKALRKSTSGSYLPWVPWEPECKINATIEAEVYVVADPKNPPAGLLWAWDFLEKASTEDMPNPGDFLEPKYPDGDRVLRVRYTDLPWAMRKWYEEETEKKNPLARYIAVFEGNAFFAPGFVNRFTPLFAGKDIGPGENACQDEIMDLSKWHDQDYRRKNHVRFFSYYGQIITVGNTVRFNVVAVKESQSITQQEVDFFGTDDEVRSETDMSDLYEQWTSAEVQHELI